MDPNLQELMAAGDEGEVEAIIRLVSPDTPPKGVRIVARFGDIATCRLPRAAILETWADDTVQSLKAPTAFGPDVDEELEEALPRPEAWSEADVRRPENVSADGRGVIVGVIDWGFDFAHDNFRNPDGSTRILALWDQTAGTDPAPEPYRYGRVFTRDEINAALASTHPYGSLGYHPGKSDPRGRGTHGTHVLDIAAGNGRLAGSPCGLAPQAELLLVHSASRGAKEPANLGDSVTLLEAIDWIRRQAGTRPFVCNMSVGRHGGPHTGLTLVEQCIDRLLLEAPGRCVVQSAGNYYRSNTHASGQLRPGQTRTVRWHVEPADRTANELEIWYAKSDALSVSLSPPSGDRPLSLRQGGQAPIKEAGQVIGRFYHRARDPSNGDHHVNIFLYPNAPAGEWRVTLFGEDVIDGRYHVWVERDSGCPGCQSRLHASDADPMTTTGTICNGQRNIAVGAYDAHEPNRRLGRFSSSGPTVDGRYKPDLIAPGVRIWAARSTPPDSDEPIGDLALNSGTSMAAPHVAGAVALIFEAAERPLMISETRRILLGSTQPAEDVDDQSRWRIGSGYLDVAAAERATREWVRRYPSMPDAEVSEHEEESPAEARTAETLDDAPAGRDAETVPAGDQGASACSCDAERPAFPLLPSIARCLTVLATQPFPDEQRKRLLALMVAALNEDSVDSDLYINGTNPVIRTLAQGVAPPMPPGEFQMFVANERVRQDLGDPYFAPLDESDEFVKANLQALDERILSGIYLIDEEGERNPGNPILRQMRQVVSAEQRNPRSIYFCYGAGQS